MAIYKHPIPILEHDTNPRAVINHDRHPEIIFPHRAVFAFLGDLVDDYAREQNAEVLDTYHTITRDYPIYRIQYKGENLCLCRAPLGGAAAVQLMDHLIGHGVKSIIATGSCGTLAAIPENAFLIPSKALRDEGASYQYLPPSRYVEIPASVRNAIKNVLRQQHCDFMDCITWTTDGFYRETEEMVTYRRAEHCLTVEMECASLAACAQFRDVQFGQLLYTADSLADTRNHDERSWGADAMPIALKLCLEIALDLP